MNTDTQPVYPIIQGHTAFSLAQFHNMPALEGEYFGRNPPPDFHSLKRFFHDRLIRLITLLRYTYPYDIQLNHQLNVLHRFLFQIQHVNEVKSGLNAIHERVKQEKQDLLNALRSNNANGDIKIQAAINAFFPIYAERPLFDIIDELFFHYACSVVGLITEVVKETAETVRRTDAGIYGHLGISAPINGIAFSNHCSANIHRFHRARFRCETSGVEFAVTPEGTIRALSWHSSAADTLAQAIFDHCQRRGWFSLSLTATAEQAALINLACRKQYEEKGIWMPEYFEFFSSPSLILHKGSNLAL